MSFEITQASREQLIGSIAFMGASGAGKTLSALKTAKGFMDAKYGDSISEDEKWKKVGVIDTEHERSKIYANNSNHGIGAFSHLDFQKPYNLDRFDDAVIALKKHGCEVIIVDSISHFWEGEGGILDLQQSYGGTFQAWRDTNPHYANFVSLVTGERHGIDMLNCMRSKQSYEVSTNETGKLKVEKIGLKPVQRDSLEYEFHITFQIDMNHQAVTVKDNSELFKDIPRVIDSEVGEKIYKWLKEGVDVHAEERAKKEEEDKQKESIIKVIKAYTEVDEGIFVEYVEGLIKQTEDKYGDLMNLPLERLQGFVTLIDKKYKEVQEPKEVEHDLPESSYEDLTLKDLQQMAKAKGIKGYSSMKKEELYDAIKQG